MYYLYPLGGGLMILFFVQKYTSLTRIAKDVIFFLTTSAGLGIVPSVFQSQVLVHTEDIQKEKVVSIGIFIITWVGAWSDFRILCRKMAGNKWSSAMVKLPWFFVVYGHPSHNGYITSY